VHRILQECIAQLRPFRALEIGRMDAAEKLSYQRNVVVVQAIADSGQLHRNLRDREMTQVPCGIGVVDPTLERCTHAYGTDAIAAAKTAIYVVRRFGTAITTSVNSALASFGAAASSSFRRVSHTTATAL